MTNEIKERPILMSAPMATALKDGLKTQTRRTIKLNNWDGNIADALKHCPYGSPGDRLWVRETFYIDNVFYIGVPLTGKEAPDDMGQIYYRADGECCDQIPDCSCAEVGPPKWRPSIFMPRWASRFLLEVTDVRVQRLLDIDEADAMAEGLTCYTKDGKLYKYGLESGLTGDWPWTDWRYTAISAYEKIWTDINGKSLGHTWKDNPAVYAVTFRVLAANQSA